MATRGLCLVIEDDEDISGLIAYIVNKEGFDVHPATCGADGIEAAACLSPSLITVDIGLPDMDGRDVARQLRHLTTVPILMITAVAGTDDEFKGMIAGADAYLTKPFSPVKLRNAIEALCPRQPAAQPATFLPYELGRD